MLAQLGRCGFLAFELACLVLTYIHFDVVATIHQRMKDSQCGKIGITARGVLSMQTKVLFVCEFLNPPVRGFIQIAPVCLMLNRS
jgi:hypothetical protein